MRKIKLLRLSLLVNIFCFCNVSNVSAEFIDNFNHINETNQYEEQTIDLDNTAEFNDIPDDIKNDINSVKSLMRLETIQILGNKNLHNTQNNKYKSKDNFQVLNNNLTNNNEYISEPYIKSIYGVGSKLKAKINYKQHDYIYKKGQQHPVGIKPSVSNILLMTDFTGLCVTLVGGSNTYDLCLNNK